MCVYYQLHASFSRYSFSPWIGLSQLHTPGGYRWVTAHSLKWQTWAVGHPVAPGLGQDCVYVGADNLMYSESCTVGKHYVCQTKPREGKFIFLEPVPEVRDCS